MIIKIKQWESKYLKEIIRDLGFECDEQLLYNKISSMYYNFVSLYNKEPFTITFGRSNGFCINSNSYVGVISYDDIILYIESMVPELSLGKILYMRSQSNLDLQETKTGDLIKEQLNDEDFINAVDYYIVSLIDSIEKIRQNGVLSTYSKVERTQNLIQGKLDIPKQIKKSPVYDKFYTIKNMQSADNPVNQILKTALEKAKNLTTLDWILPHINRAISYFPEVSHIKDTMLFKEIHLSDYTTLVRTDYEEALLFSKYILFGFDPISGENPEMFPEFIIDMNALFENYVTAGLNKIFKEGFVQKATFTLGLGENDPPIDLRYIELDGFYNHDNKRVVVDTKNKYRKVIDSNIDNYVSINPDLYQQYYYASRLNSNKVVLVYPSSRKKTSPIGHYFVEFEECKRVDFYCWGLNIAGTPRENKLALNGLALFIDSL